MQMDLRMRLEEGLNLLRLVRREVIDNDMDLAPARLGRRDVTQEVDKSRAGVSRDGLADDLAGREC
jgi:hypothetical protein